MLKIKISTHVISKRSKEEYQNSRIKKILLTSETPKTVFDHKIFKKV